MSEETRGKRGGWLWLLVLLAIVLIWIFWRPPADNGRAAGAGDEIGAASDEVIVDFSDADGDARVAEVGRLVGLDFHLVSDQAVHERLYRAHVDPARRDAVLAQLAALPDVEAAEPDATYSLIDGTTPGPVTDDDAKWKGYPNDPQFKYQWHLVQIGMPAAWKLADGSGVIVAVIDTGVAYEKWKNFHQVPDLAETKFVKGYDFVGNSVHADDDHGHGTHVAGTIAQSTNNGIGVAGVAPGATIMPLKVLSASGSGSVAGIADAIHYAADNGAKVINMSLGGRFRSKVLEKAVKYAHDKGVVVVCAAGNDGSNRVSYPAAYPGAIAVAATQFDETTTFYSNSGKEIDIAAPGGNTQVDQNGDGMPDGVLQNTIVIGDPTRDGYFPFMGTSMASPHVAGVAALVVAQGVTDPDAVEKVLKDAARKPKNGKLDTAKYGAGIVDAPAAIKAAHNTTGGFALGLGLLMAGALAAHARRRGAVIALGPLYLAGVLFGASGLFFLPQLGLFSQPFPSWDMALLGVAGHGNPLFFSALAPLGLLALAFSVRRLRAPLAGFSAGVGAALVFNIVARTTDLLWLPGVFVDDLWLGANAILCAVLAYTALRD
jgi:serine protease